MPEGPEEKKSMESAVRANANNSNPALTELGAGGASPLKIRMVLKVFVFCCSTVTLSWFFEGLRQCKEVPGLQGPVVLAVGAILTLALVALQGFFIYCEERSKGGHTRKIALFDSWYEILTKKKGDSTNRG
jgi:hypothetical protein